MIELVIASRCIDCDRCVKVCPTDVFDAVPGGHPVIARQQDCQTCFLCELYCPTDALYVGPDCEQPEPVDEQAITQTDWPQQYRRDSGWGQEPPGPPQRSLVHAAHDARGPGHSVRRTGRGSRGRQR